MFNKKIKKESIIENVNVLNNITEYTALIDKKRVCLGDIHEYLYENINDIHANTKNKEYEKVLADLLLIQKRTFISINKMCLHNVNKKITAINKKINNSTKKNDMSSTAKKSNKYTNKKITIANNANNKITNANNTNANNINKKITNTNNTNEKITNTNNANKKIINTNNANEKSTNGNSANNNSTNTIKKSSITIRLKRPHVIY